MSPKIPKLVLGTVPARVSDFPDSCIPDRKPENTPGYSLLRQLQQRFLSDEALVKQLQEGYADALTCLFERHASSLLRVARRILRNEAESEDAVQQIFLDVFRSIHQFDARKGSFRTWLMLFGYQRVFNCRRSLTARRFFATDTFDEFSTDSPLAAESAFRFSLPEASILVEEILSSLSQRQRRTIELIYFDGLTADEVSQRTGESIRVVRHNLYRGLERLKKAFRDAPDGADRKGGANDRLR